MTSTLERALAAAVRGPGLCTPRTLARSLADDLFPTKLREPYTNALEQTRRLTPAVVMSVVKQCRMTADARREAALRMAAEVGLQAFDAARSAKKGAAAGLVRGIAAFHDAFPLEAPRMRIPDLQPKGAKKVLERQQELENAIRNFRCAPRSSAISRPNPRRVAHVFHKASLAVLFDHATQQLGGLFARGVPKEVLVDAARKLVSRPIDVDHSIERWVGRLYWAHNDTRRAQALQHLVRVVVHPLEHG